MTQLPQRSRCERCALCGAPLRDLKAYVVTCDYCHEENRLVAKETEDAHRHAEAVTRAADEARAMARRLAQRRDELQAAFGEAMKDFVADRSPSKGALALHAYEALLRILQAPSVHIAIAMGPTGIPVMKQIDESIRNILIDFAAENGIERG